MLYAGEEDAGSEYEDGRKELALGAPLFNFLIFKQFPPGSIASNQTRIIINHNLSSGLGSWLVTRDS